MEEELHLLNKNFDMHIQQLMNIKQNYLNSINKWTIFKYNEKNDIHNISIWYNNQYNNLIKIKDIETKKIKKKYSIRNNSNNSISNNNNYSISNNSNYSISNNSNYNSIPLKKALLIGINYKNTSSELRGCINDVDDLKNLLITKYNYKESNILTLTESQATKENIINQLSEFINSGNDGETLFFSFSGHGYFLNDNDNNYKIDEYDQKDEVIISVDNYAIIDDELKDIIDANLKCNVTLIALFDNCHSGTILDLAYQYNKGYQNTIHNKLSKDTSGNVICLSGCKDDQVSMDAYLKGKFNGAMIFNFIEILKENNILTWKQFLDNLRRKLNSNNFNQVPQITSGRQLNLNTLAVQL